jgi:hypothetical protein
VLSGQRIAYARTAQTANHSPCAMAESAADQGSANGAQNRSFHPGIVV